MKKRVWDYGYLFLSIVHGTFNVDAHHGIGGIRTYGYRLAERTGKLAFAVVCYADLSGLSGHDGLLCILGDGASARRESLLNDKRFVARIGKSEYVRLHVGLLECSEIV